MRINRKRRIIGYAAVTAAILVFPAGCGKETGTDDTGMVKTAEEEEKKEKEEKEEKDRTLTENVERMTGEKGNPMDDCPDQMEIYERFMDGELTVTWK